jgi:hypothetical protein
MGSLESIYTNIRDTMNDVEPEELKFIYNLSVLVVSIFSSLSHSLSLSILVMALSQSLSLGDGSISSLISLLVLFQLK